jgi:hypothetical protein
MITNKSKMGEMPNLADDLEWLKHAPSLLSTAQIMNQLRSFNPSNDFVATSSTSREEFPALKSSRLGLYFEQLFTHLLQSSQHYQLVATNLQIHRDGRTIGEFDCLLRALADSSLIHLELAVKFYLQLGTGQQMSDWVGPNYRDRLDIKYEHLLKHQLQLAEHPDVTAWLKARNLTIDSKALFTRGRLYYQLNNFLNASYCFPSEVISGHQKGFWCSLDEFTDFQSSKPGLKWFKLPKPFWFADISSKSLDLLQPFLLPECNQLQQVVAVSSHREHMRGFVVTDEWLASARAQLARDLG